MEQQNEISSNFTLTFATRQQALRAHFAAYGLKYTELATKMGVSPRAAINLCLNETASPLRVDQMKEYGIPEELLPEPLYVKPGRKSSRKNEEVEVPSYDA